MDNNERIGRGLGSGMGLLQGAAATQPREVTELEQRIKRVQALKHTVEDRTDALRVHNDRIQGPYPQAPQSERASPNNLASIAEPPLLTQLDLVLDQFTRECERLTDEVNRALRL